MTHRSRHPAIFKVVGIQLLALSLIAAPALVSPAQALQLCEGVSDEVCREDVEASVEALIASLVANITVEKDRRSPVIELQQALRQFDIARLEIDDADQSLTDEQICSRAGKQDDRGLKKVSRGVKAAAKIASSKFTSEAAFTETRTKISDLVGTVIDAVTVNVDEVEAAVGEIADVLDARSRIDTANTNLDDGKLDKAADNAQRAYDAVRDEGNIAGCLDNQVS